MQSIFFLLLFWDSRRIVRACRAPHVKPDASTIDRMQTCDPRSWDMKFWAARVVSTFSTRTYVRTWRAGRLSLSCPCPTPYTAISCSCLPPKVSCIHYIQFLALASFQSLVTKIGSVVLPRTNKSLLGCMRTCFLYVAASTHDQWSTCRQERLAFWTSSFLLD